MPLQEMTHVEHNSLIPTAEDIYDDGFLRVEHKNYYVACGGSPIKLPLLTQNSGVVQLDVTPAA